jgi:D-alanyl-D-alanine carboxypeptidase/D-alanyl-D-alanine-endopeptidase (penicillin-binding protein 4)
VGGLNFNDNCVDITVTPTSEGKAVTYTVMPPVGNIEVINKCTSASKGKPDIERELDANVYTLKGAATQPTTLPSKSVTEPGAFFADALRTHLETHGVHVQGKTIKSEKPLGSTLVPPPDSIVAVHESKMSDIMWRINKSSQNLFAEAMCKNLGRASMAKQKLNVPGSWRNGTSAVLAFLHKNKINTTGYVIEDGSGLSREDRVTAHLVSDVFRTMYHHPYYEDFRQSLSAAGEDGTLRTRMKDITGHFFGKTGYIGGVRSLSGYVKTKSGRWLVVSMIFNGIEPAGLVKPIEDMQDDVVRVLVDYPNIASTQPTVAVR